MHITHLLNICLDVPMSAVMMVLDIANGWKTLIMIVAMIAVFYFFLIKPQTDKAKKDAEYHNSLKQGDKLVTAGGIHVTFLSHDGAYAYVEVSQGVKIRVQLTSLGPIPERAKPVKTKKDKA